MAKAQQTGPGGTAGDHHSPSTIAGKTGAGTTRGDMGSAEAAVSSERARSHTRSQSASPKRRSRVKAPAAGGVKKSARSKGEVAAQEAKDKIRSVEMEVADMKAFLGQALGITFDPRPEEPAVQEPIGT